MPRNRQAMQVLPVSLANDDVCTLVSIVPFLISEFKPGIYPGRFVIPPCLNEKGETNYKFPETLLVGTSVHFIAQYNGDDEMPSHVVKTYCKEMAESIVSDYMRGQMDCTEFIRPGLVWVRGTISGPEFVKNHVATWMDMIAKQNKWFGKLVDRADNDWRKYHNHMVVSDNQRFAARVLGLDKEWLTRTDSSEVPVKCPACLSRCSPDAILCSNCRCILKPEEYKKLTFAA